MSSEKKVGKSLQGIIEKLNGLDEASVVRVLSAVLQDRPELAPPVVDLCVPELTYSPAKCLEEQRSRGRIKPFDRANGYAFIDCPFLYKIFDCDVWVDARKLRSFTAGTEVSFAVVLNTNMRPQAYDLQPVFTQEGSACVPLGGVTSTGTPASSSAPMNVGMNPFGFGAQANPLQSLIAGQGSSSMDNTAALLAALDSAADTSAFLSGGGRSMLQPGPSFSQSGFFAQGGSDSLLQSAPFGQSAISSERPMQSRWDQSAPLGQGESTGALAMPSAAQSSSALSEKAKLFEELLAGKGPGKGKGKFKSNDGQQDPDRRVPGEKETLGRYHGVVKNVNEKQGYCFLYCADLKLRGLQDVYVHSTQRNGFKVGDAVEFTCFLNMMDQPRAKNLQAAVSVNPHASAR